MKGCNYLKVVGVIAVISLIFSSMDAFAGNRWIDDTLSTDLSLIIRDDIRNKIYLADSATNDLVIIDSATEQVAERIALSGKVDDMAISKDGTLLDVAAGGLVTRVDLNSLSSHQYSVPKGVEGEVRSVAFDSNRRVLIMVCYPDDGTTRRFLGKIYLLNGGANKTLTVFGVGPNLDREAYQGLLKTDATGTILYVGERGLSPLSIYKIDVTNAKKPEFLAEDNHGDLGSNLKDFAISPRYDEIYVASGAPYGIQVVDSQTLAYVDILYTGPYPCGVDVSVDGSTVYGIPSNPYSSALFKFDAMNRTLIESYEFITDPDVTYGSAQERGVTVDRFNEKAFVIHGEYVGSHDKVQVVDVADLNS